VEAWLKVRRCGVNNGGRDAQALGPLVLPAGLRLVLLLPLRLVLLPPLRAWCCC